MSTASSDHAPLRHVIVVGGSLAEWAATTEAQWADRVAQLGKVADHVGASWLSLRPYGGPGDAVAGRVADVGGCRVSVEPDADGRARLVAAVEALRSAGAEVTESSLAAQLNLPAQADPDLVVVVGPEHHLPPSLVWELAYAELVFVATDWQHLSAAHLEDAIASYAHRHRRFGGID